MRPIALITIHPKIIEAYRQFGVLKSAEVAGLASIAAVDLRDFAADKHGSVDAPPYGGGDGMVMRVDCLSRAVDSVVSGFQGERNPRVIYTSPAGRPWTQAEAAKLASEDAPLIFVCGRFAGVDQRFIDTYVDLEFSVGDVVLAGGELPSLMMLESILRLVPGVLGHERSATDDSFAAGLEGLLEYPLFTRPLEWRGVGVPDVLTSGNHEAIATWRRNESMAKTRSLRPDLLTKRDE